MSKESLFDPEKLFLKRIEVKEFNFSDKKLQHLNGAERDIELSFGSSRGLNMKNKAIGFGIRVFYKVLENEGKLKIPCLSADIMCHFIVENLSDLIIERPNGETEINNDLITSVAAISYSTARGIIFEKTNGTFLQGILLPVRPVSNIIID